MFPHNIETYMMIDSFGMLFSNTLIYVGYQQTQKFNQRCLSFQLAKQKDEAEAAYFKTLEDYHNQQRALLHDIRRHLTAIKEIEMCGCITVSSPVRPVRSVCTGLKPK